MKEKSGWKCTTSILAQKGGSVVILSNNGQSLKLKFWMRYVTNYLFKWLFSNPFNLASKCKGGKCTQFPKKTLTKFLNTSNLDWHELLPFAWYCFNIFPGSSGTESPFFLMFGWDLAEGYISLIKNSNRYYGTNEGKMVLEELHKLLKHHANHLK